VELAVCLVDYIIHLLLDILFHLLELDPELPIPVKHHHAVVEPIIVVSSLLDTLQKLLAP
jgi:hypothetical protein